MATSWKTRLDALWTQVTAEPGRPAPDLPQEPRFLRAENLLDAFAHEKDTLPRGRSMVVERKLLHPVGCVGLVEYAPLPANRCRGLLATPAHGLARLSNGNISDQGGIAPGVGLKFPRTGLPSADMVFGPDGFDERDGDDAFVTRAQRTWLGIIPDHPAYRDIRTLFWIFDKIREQGRAPTGEGLPAACPMGFGGRAVSIEPLLTHTQHGTATPATSEDPIGLEMVPTPHFFDAWQANRGRYLEVLPHIPPGPLYDVSARWGDGRTTPIGRLSLRERFVTSAFGDARLFFRHPPQCPDLRLAPLHEASST